MLKNLSWYTYYEYSNLFCRENVKTEGKKEVM